MAEAAGQGSVVSPDDLDALTAVYGDIAATLLNQYELTFTSQAFDDAELSVRFEREGVVAERVVAEDVRTLELPTPPEVPEPEPVGKPEVPEEDPAALDDEAAALPSPLREPPATGW